MSPETSLLATIAVSLVFALLGGFVAARLHLPPLIGYLLAGIAVGPFTPGFVANTSLAPELAEIGVILLMFGVGMHFSVADLWAMRRVAVPGAVVRTVLITLLGIAIALGWGWSVGAGVVFGLALSAASTVVVLRVLPLQGPGSLQSPTGQISLGWLVVEDLIMILTLVLLPSLSGALGGTAPADSGATGLTDVGLALSVTLLKVAVFVTAMLALGTRLFPWILAQVERAGSRELFTLAVIALALGVAFGSAELFGISFALGAFFAGVVINESELSHRAALDLEPLQTAFTALFFVAVGMLFDPHILLQEPLRVVIVLAIVVLAKLVVTLGIVLALKQPMGTAVGVSAALAQIGEFSFILAELGLGLGLLPAEGYNLVLAGALLSITLNPLIFRAASRAEVVRAPAANA